MTTSEEDDFYSSGNVRDEGYPVPPMGHNSGESLEDVLKGLDFDDMMKEARVLLLKTLYHNVKMGMATPQELNTLRQLLKDNGMIMGDPEEGAQEGSPRDREKADLPEYSHPDYGR